MTADEFIDEWRSDRDYIVAHTSGSTGAPKEIHLPKRLVEASALRTISYFGITSRSRLHLPLSPDYIAGKMMIVRALLSGASLTVEPPSNVLEGLDAAKPIDLIALVPSQLETLLASPGRLEGIADIIVGGSPLSPQAAARCRELPCRVTETYGMTETASHIALRRVGDELFTPLPGIGVALSAAGTLEIDLGYFGRFATNDLAVITPDSRFAIIGRADDAIISGGLKVHPAQVERKIAAEVAKTFGSATFAVTSRPHPIWVNETVLAVNLPNLTATFAGAPEQQIEGNLLTRLRQLLPPQEAPRAIVYIPQWPRTSTGKTRRKALSNLISDRKGTELSDGKMTGNTTAK